jgi:hypothetical protein
MSCGGEMKGMYPGIICFIIPFCKGIGKGEDKIIGQHFRKKKNFFLEKKDCQTNEYIKRGYRNNNNPDKSHGVVIK